MYLYKTLKNICEGSIKMYLQKLFIMQMFILTMLLNSCFCDAELIRLFEFVHILI